MADDNDDNDDNDDKTKQIDTSKSVGSAFGIESMVDLPPEEDDDKEDE